MILDHVNVYVRDLESMSRFYQDILGLTPGYRPSFSGSSGAWLYDGSGRPVVHLSTTSTGSSRRHQHLDHIAFRTDNLKDIIKKLDLRNIEYDLYEVPEINLVQIFFHDPEGGRLEVSATKASQ